MRIYLSKEVDILKTSLLVLSLVVLSLGGYILYEKAISPHPQVAGLSSPSLPGKFDNDSFLDVLEAGAVVNPTYQDIQSDVNISGIVQLNQNTAPSPTTDKLYNVGGALYWNGINLTNNTGYWTASGNNIYNNNTGNVGIGTPGPNAKLDINNYLALGDSGNLIAFQQGGGKGTYGADASHFPIRAFESYGWNFTTQNVANSGFRVGPPTCTGYLDCNYFVVKYGGNVGIGLTNPAAKLEVDGGVIVQDRLYIWGDGNGWGNSIINGRVWSASSNIHLSPPGGSSVIIDGNYREAGGGTGTVNLCLNGDCRSAWPGGGSSVLATFNGGRTDLCDYCSGTSISGSLTAPANGILTLDYALLMDSPYCGVVISTYVDGVRIREENVRGCFGPLKAGNSDCSDSGAPSQAFTYKAAVSAGSHSFWVNGWTGGGACGNTRGFQVSPAYFQWQP